MSALVRVAFLLFSCFPLSVVAGGPAGVWEFCSESDLGRPTVGCELVVIGERPRWWPEMVDGEGIRKSGVIETKGGVGSQLRVEHGLDAKDGERRVNQFTLVFDLMRGEQDRWHALYHAGLEERLRGDAAYFIRKGGERAGQLGRGTLGYSGKAIPAGRWVRVVVVVDLGERGVFDTYVDGELFHRHSPPPPDSEFSLAPEGIQLFGDNDGENEPLLVGGVAIFGRALWAEEIEAMGDVRVPLAVDPRNRAPEVKELGTGALAVATGQGIGVGAVAEDPEGQAVSVQFDWGDGTRSRWAGEVGSGEELEVIGRWHRPGEYLVKARARDSGGAVSGWAEQRRVTVTGAPELKVRTPPYLQNMSPTGMVVMVEIEEEIELELAYSGGEGGSGSVAMGGVASGGGSFFYRGVLAGLEPDTTYRYQIQAGGEAICEAGSFRTGKVEWTDFGFAAIGDVQTDNRIRVTGEWAWEEDPWEPAKKMLAHMVERDVDLGLGLGDHASDGDSYASTRRSHLDRMAAIFGVKKPFYIAWGNHDGNQPEHPLRLSADMPSRHRTDADSRYTSGFGSYSFEHAGVFFLCLEHFSLFRGGHGYQAGAGNDITNGWVERQLSSEQAKRARFRIVAVHVPPYCERWIDGNEGLRRELVPLMEKYGVNLCLSGHMHGYQRGEKGGVHYVISGCGSYLDIGEPLTTDWEHMTVGGHTDVEGRYARQASQGVLGEPQAIQGGLFHGYLEAQVRGEELLLKKHGFHADGSYIGVMDEIVIGGGKVVGD